MMPAPAPAMQRKAIGLMVVTILPALLTLLTGLPLRLLLAAGDEGGQAINIAAFAAGLLRALAVLLIVLMLRLMLLVLRLILLMRLMLLMLALLIRPVMITLLVGLTVAGRIRLLLHLAGIMRLATLWLRSVIV